MLFDPIANMLCSIKNASKLRKKSVTIPFSKIKYAILKQFEAHRLISEINEVEEFGRRFLEIKLAYSSTGRQLINEIKRESRLSLRKYVNVCNMLKIRRRNMLHVISTNNGVMSLEKARKLGIGGELICSVW